MAPPKQSDERNDIAPPVHLEAQTVQEGPDTDYNVVEKQTALHDGDEALKVLAEGYETYTPEEERKLLWKIDLRVCALMFFIQGLQFVDKNTLSYAETYGIIEQTHLVGQEFSLLVTIFYLGYFVAQYPAGLLMQRYPMGKFIIINFVLWGVALAASAAATDFSSLAAGRFFLGLFESPWRAGAAARDLRQRNQERPRLLSGLQKDSLT